MLSPHPTAPNNRQRYHQKAKDLTADELAEAIEGDGDTLSEAPGCGGCQVTTSRWLQDCSSRYLGFVVAVQELSS